MRIPASGCGAMRCDAQGPDADITRFIFDVYDRDADGCGVVSALVAFFAAAFLCLFCFSSPLLCLASFLPYFTLL